MVKLGGLWLKEGKNGKFMSGKLGSANIMIFPNKNKKTDKHPDYEIVVASPKPPADTRKGAKTPYDDSDEIPF